MALQCSRSVTSLPHANMSDQPSSTTIFGADPEVVRRVSASAEAQEITERGLFLAQRLCDPDNDLSTPVIENLIQAMHHQRIEAQRLLLKAYMAREQQNEVEGRRLEQALWEDVQELQERVEEVSCV